ncbi:MAG: lytic transglycosylase domain-containing protein, partial [Proteobacteria bacterium]
GVVGARLVRQPRSLDEARATAQMLESKGYNYSLGAAQVNRVNFRKYGLDTFEKAFDPCTNLSAGASILAGCYASAGGHWGKAFSCYYSGNFVTGFRSGYVQKVYDSISRGNTLAQAPIAPPGTIPLRPIGAPSTAALPASKSAQVGGQPSQASPSTAASRISMRVVPIGTTTQTAAAAASAAATSAPDTPANVPTATSDVFVPQVRVPGTGTLPGPPTQAAPLNRTAGDGAFVF